MKLNWANSIKTYLKVLSFVLLTIFFIGPFITSSYAALIFEGDFETGDLGDFYPSGIPPVVTSSLSRAGTYTMESLIEPGEKRSEVTRGEVANVGEEYWYGFSIFLPEGYIVNDVSYEILAQWHGRPDFDIGEDWRNPIMALDVDEGTWAVVIRYDSKRNTFESGERVYDGQEYFDFGSYETGVWTDWVFHVKWSYESDGLLEIWKNGVKVLYREGPNAFNDAEGPYFKMGIYSGDVPCTRIVYHDEFRMADANSTYADVAPGGNGTEPEPSVPGLATLLSPSGTIDETTPTFTWNAVEGATMYLLYVEGSSGTVIEQWYDADTITTGDTCSVTPDVQLQEGNYFWEIQTRNDVGYGNWSSALQFSVAATEPSVPGTATLLSPSSSTKDKTPTYTWNMVEGATMYLLYVEGHSGTVIEQWYDADTITTGDTCSVTPDVTLARGKYSWGIRASNDNGYGDWSNALLFKVVGKK